MASVVATAVAGSFQLYIVSLFQIQLRNIYVG